VSVAQDSHGQDTNGAPIADPEQDYTLVGGRQNESHTVVRFRRAMDTCDRNHDYVLRVSPAKLLPSSPKQSTYYEFVVHSERNELERRSNERLYLHSCISHRRLSAKFLPTFADRGYHVVSVTDPYDRILGFLDRIRYFSYNLLLNYTHEAEWTPFQT
jgi:hypothetical protein